MVAKWNSHMVKLKTMALPLPFYILPGYTDHFSYHSIVAWFLDADEEISQEEEEGDGERKRKGRRVKVDSAKKIKMGQPDDKGVVVVESDSGKFQYAIS